MYVERLYGEVRRDELILSTERRVLEFSVDTCHTHHVYLMTSSSSVAFEVRLSNKFNLVSILDATVSTDNR